MKVKFAPKLTTLSLLAAALCLPALAQDTVLTYQGQVLDNGTNFDGPGQFKFALVTSPSSSTYVTYWSNDGTSVAGSEPSAAVGVSVSKGLFTVVLGDTTLAHMAALPRSVFTTQPNLQLRIWFNDGVNGFAALSPVQNLTPAPYAVVANSAINLLGGDVSAGDVSAGSVEVAGPLYLPSIGVYPVVIYSGGSLLMDADNQHNFFTGPSAGNLTLAGSLNTGIGIDALQFDTTGAANTALGEQALEYNTSGSYNTAIGFQALVNNTNGGYNTALGALALGLNTNGNNNTASGYGALVENRTGNDNTASGFEALYNNTNGNENVASGYRALYNNLGGSYNTAYGDSALFSNTNGSYNVADGYLALQNLSSGIGNIALGATAGQNLITGNNDIYIGNPGTGASFSSTENNTVRIGNPGVQTATYLVGTVYANGVALTSDRNVKENFAVINAREVLAKVASLPVTKWNYKTDSQGVQHIGPMAQDFQAAFGLDGTDDKHISVVDEGGVALAAIQGLNQKLNEQAAQLNTKDAEIDQLKQRLDTLEKMISARTDNP